MDWILLICSIIIIFVGYTVIKNVQNSVKTKAVEPAPEPLQTEGRPLALIFGFSKPADALIALLRSYDIEFLQIGDQNQLDYTKEYTHVFALSGSDLENLLINTLVNRINKSHKKIAICNIPDNSVIYQQSGILSISGDKLSAQQLFQIMFPSYSGTVIDCDQPITAKL